MLTICVLNTHLKKIFTFTICYNLILLNKNIILKSEKYIVPTICVIHPVEILLRHSIEKSHFKRNVSSA